MQLISEVDKSGSDVEEYVANLDKLAGGSVFSISSFVQELGE